MCFLFVFYCFNWIFLSSPLWITCQIHVSTKQHFSVCIYIYIIYIYICAYIMSVFEVWTVHYDVTGTTLISRDILSGVVLNYDMFNVVYTCVSDTYSILHVALRACTAMRCTYYIYTVQCWCNFSNVRVVRKKPSLHSSNDACSS